MKRRGSVEVVKKNKSCYRNVMKITSSHTEVILSIHQRPKVFLILKIPSHLRNPMLKLPHTSESKKPKLFLEYKSNESILSTSQFQRRKHLDHRSMYLQSNRVQNKVQTLLNHFHRLPECSTRPSRQLPMFQPEMPPTYNRQSLHLWTDKGWAIDSYLTSRLALNTRPPLSTN